MKLLFWLTITLQLATAQIGLQPPIQKEIDEVREYYAYNVRIAWENQEFLDNDSSLDITYDFARLTIFLYSPCRPDSIIVAKEFGDGLREYGIIQWKKGYNMGIKEIEMNNWERLLYGFCGAAIFGGIYISIDMMGK